MSIAMRHRRVVSAAILAAVMGQPTKAASEQAIRVDIAPQTLDGALNQLAEAAGLELSYPGALSAGIKSPGLAGHYTADQALGKLLAGTGLAYRYTGAKTITLERLVANSAEPFSAGDVITLGKVTVSADTAYEPDDPYNPDYARRNASTATKTDTPIMETPVSIQVVPQQVLKDQQAYRIQDAVKNVSGVQQRFSTGGNDRFIVRGFDLGEIQYRNGIRLSNLNFDLANVQQVEVLKGPASVLYGRTEPGGLINIVTKRPLSQPYYSIEQRFGSYDYYRTQLDATGSITKDGSLLYGFDLSYLNSDSFRDFISSERIFVAPSLSWRPSEDTEVNLTLEYLNYEFGYDSGIPALGKRVAPIPISRNFGQPGLGLTDIQENTLVDFNWSHRFSDNWKFRNGVLWSHSNFRFNDIYASSGASIIDNRVNREAWFGHADADLHTVYATLNGKFDTWGVAHDVLVGGEYYYFERSELDRVVRAIDTIDIFNPVYTFIDVDKQILSQTPNTKIVQDDSWFGIYFQDQLTLWNDLHIMGGGRYDWATVTSGYGNPDGFNAETLRDSKFSPRVGVDYRPVEWLSLYGHWVESFGTNNGRSSTGKPFQPQTAAQYEGGVKTEFFDGRLTASVAYFHLTKNNLVTNDPNDRRFQVAIGEARSRGVEVDIAGQIIDGLSLITTYAYTDTEVTKDFSGRRGKRLPYVPLHSGSIWLKYDFQQEPLDGLSVGGGVYLADRRFGDVDNSFYDPGYARVDLYAAYRYRIGPTHLTAQVNLNNVTDTEYFIMRSRANNQPAEPLTVLGSLRLEY
jgi:iron complex outermembrane receptor protein